MDIFLGLVTFLGPALMGVSIGYPWLLLERRWSREHLEPAPPLVLALLLAAAGAGVTLAATIVWMVWYEKTTGFSAGNAPLGWIFITGPGGVAIAVVYGFVVRKLGLGKRARDLF
jgi:hypothetical protein